MYIGCPQRKWTFAAVFFTSGHSTEPPVTLTLADMITKKNQDRPENYDDQQP